MINKDQRKYLRSLAHNCKPVIWIGQHGLTDSVMKEIDIALDHHELIKIKVRAGERGERELVTANVCKKSNAELIQKIGNTVTVYRRNEETPVISFPKSRQH